MVDRQDIIERSINLENLICMLITLHFFPAKGVKLDFMQIVMCDPSANTAFKVSVFSKCYPQIKRDLIEKMSRMFNIRNLFAHCGLHVTSFADPDNSGIMNPKKMNEPIDFEALRKEFLEKESQALGELFKLVDAAGIELKSEAG